MKRSIPFPGWHGFFTAVAHNPIEVFCGIVAMFLTFGGGILIYETYLVPAENKADKAAGAKAQPAGVYYQVESNAWHARTYKTQRYTRDSLGCLHFVALQESADETHDSVQICGAYTIERHRGAAPPFFR
jgi:hypothetical protein